MTIAIIPARGGSKGIPNKNLVDLGGKPLLAHSIQCAQRVKGIERVIVTTDSPRIRRVALKYGASVPFLRPRSLARDSTPGVLPILHAVRWLERNEEASIDKILVLQPTSPLRSPGDIRRALTLLGRKATPAVISVCEAREHPYWMKVIRQGALADFASVPRISVRQRLPKCYRLNGAIYAIRRAVLMEKKTLSPTGTRALLMPIERSIDIDTALDLRLTRLLVRSARKS